ncbi:MAG: ABC transporter permease [Anaerolineaceae bacterium]|nr:ABC transporter permease [Anaerolineaceae bacterium]
MNLWQAIIEALQSLYSNKLRSILTILGIVIGVGAVIAMLAVGTGAQDTITGSISGIGSNLLFVTRGNTSVTLTRIEPLTSDDAEALLDQFQAPSIAAVAPVVNATLTVSGPGESIRTTVYGVTPAYEQVRNYSVTEGTFINEEHLLGRSSVAILGPDTAEKMFGRRDGLVGETIRIEGQPFRVIGVLEAKGGSSLGSQDDLVIIPLSTAQARLVRRSENGLDMILVQVVSPEMTASASEEVALVLRNRHHTRVGEDDFTVFSQEDFVSVAKTITGVLTIFLGGIAGISLLVGGIGIMNIMLVSVTERTREIGLRKALGARRKDILIQFLTESSLLSLIGGVIGIGLGWLISFIVGRIAVANGTPFYPEISLNSILLATIFSTAVGLFFGLYPANRAAGLEPVEALRHE